MSVSPRVAAVLRLDGEPVSGSATGSGVARGDAGQTRPGGVLARWFADGGANVLLSAEVLAERHRAAETDHLRSELQQAAAAEYSLNVELSTMLEGREREPRVSRVGSDHLWRAVEESVDIDPDLHDSDLASLNLRGDTGVPSAPPAGVPGLHAADYGRVPPTWPRWARSSGATFASASADGGHYGSRRDRSPRRSPPSGAFVGVSYFLRTMPALDEEDIRCVIVGFPTAGGL